MISKEKAPAETPRAKIDVNDLGKNNVYEVILDYAGLAGLSNAAKNALKSDPSAYSKIVELANNRARDNALEMANVREIFEKWAEQIISARTPELNTADIVSEPADSAHDSSEDLIDAEEADEPVIIDYNNDTETIQPAISTLDAGMIADDLDDSSGDAADSSTSSSYPAPKSSIKEKKARNGERRTVRNRILASVGALAVAGGALLHVGVDGNHESHIQAETSHSVEANPAVNLMDQESDFFKDAVDIHKLPGTIGNNFGPSVSEQDTRIDTPEAREKTIALFEQMLKGNTDILTAYMYEFDQLGPKLDDKAWGDQAQGSDVLLRMRDEAAHLSDPKNIADHFKAVESVMNVIKTIGGGDIRRFGPDHKSYFIGPDGKIGIDSDVQDNNAVYRNYAFDLGSGKMLELPILLHCHLQPASAEIQAIIAALRMTPVIAQPFVNSPIAEVPQIIPPTTHVPEQPHGHGGNTPHMPTGGGPETPPPHPEEKDPTKIVKLPDQWQPQPDEKATVDEEKDKQARASVKKPGETANAQNNRGPNNFSPNQGNTSVNGQSQNSNERAAGAEKSSTENERSNGTLPKAEAGLSGGNKSSPSPSSSSSSAIGGGAEKSGSGAGTGSTGQSGARQASDPGA